MPSDMVEPSGLRRRWLAASGEVQVELLSGGTEEDALGLIALRALELTRSDATFIVLGPDPVDGRFSVRAQRGPEEPDMVGPTLDGSDPLLREVVDGRAAVLGAAAGALPGAFGGTMPRYGPTVAVPLRSQERVVGVLVALRRGGARPFQPVEVPVLTSFAVQAMLALEMGEKNRVQRRLDVVADRDRSARELHDHVIQRLFATGLQLQCTLRAVDEPVVRRRIQEAVEDLDETVQEIRASIFDPHRAPVADGAGRM